MFIIFVGCSSAGKLYGQDSTAQTAPVKKGPLRLFSFADPHSPKKASIYSAVIPGLGQIYNRKYLKAPIVYAALGGAAWFMLDQRKQMRNLNAEFKKMYAINPDTTLDANLVAQRDNHRRYRDFGILAITAIYALQIADAAVDAHFYKFDINQSLSARLRPNTSRFLTFTYQF